MIIFFGLENFGAKEDKVIEYVFANAVPLLQTYYGIHDNNFCSTKERFDRRLASLNKEVKK